MSKVYVVCMHMCVYIYVFASLHFTAHNNGLNWIKYETKLLYLNSEVEYEELANHRSGSYLQIFSENL